MTDCVNEVNSGDIQIYVNDCILQQFLKLYSTDPAPGCRIIRQ